MARALPVSPRLVAFAVVASASFVACNAVLGVEDARFDPSLDLLSLAGGAAGASGQAGSGGAAGSTPVTPVDDPSCVTYCDTVQANCTVELQEYPGRDTCLNMCRNMDNGPTGALTGNTIECRTAHALLAVSEPAQKVAHCLAAGPLGNGVCGDLCGAFCSLNLAYCTSPRITTPTYASASECLDACAALPFDVTSTSSYFGSTNENTLNCRDYHLQAAYKNDSQATTHCSHTAVNSSTCF